MIIVVNEGAYFMSIYDLRPGEMGIIDSVSADTRLGKRLLALGCIEGTQVTVKTMAPLGDPIVISLRGFNLAIRKNDAKNILIKGE